MRFTLTNEEGSIHSIDVDPSMEIEGLKALIEVEMNIATDKQILIYQQKQLSDPKKTLASYNLVQDDIILVVESRSITSGSISQPEPSQLEMQRRILQSSPENLRLLATRFPQLAAAVNNPTEFARLYTEIFSNRNASANQNPEKILADLRSKLAADPNNEEIKAEIKKIEKLQALSTNIEIAHEYFPESFGTVHMLYINCEVNGHPVKAFVDSGAQMTIISPSCAKACDLENIIDERLAGEARGVGRAKILGKIHAAPMKIGKQFLYCSFHILEGTDVDMLFGLDMLKRHQACIDLRKNALNINGEDIPFLSEHEIPSKKVDLPTTEVSKKPPTSGDTVVQRKETSVSSAPANKSPFYPEENISKLMEFGASRQEAIRALEVCNGNIELAASMILQL